MALQDRRQSLPLGFKFCPTDDMILTSYLPAKLRGEYIIPGLIYDCNVYGSQPSNLPGLNKEGEYSFYFTSRDQKYPNGKRIDRNTKDGHGYWRITSKLNEIRDSSVGSILGKKNTLVYFLKTNGEKGKGRKTNWIMHEYVLDESRCFDVKLNNVVLCRIYRRKPEKAETENHLSQRPTLSHESPQVGFPMEPVIEDGHHQINAGKRKQSMVPIADEISKRRNCISQGVINEPVTVNPITQISPIPQESSSYVGFQNALVCETGGGQIQHFGYSEIGNTGGVPDQSTIPQVTMVSEEPSPYVEIQNMPDCNGAFPQVQEFEYSEIGNTEGGADQSTTSQVPNVPEEPSPYVEIQKLPVSNGVFPQVQDFEPSPYVNFQNTLVCETSGEQVQYFEYSEIGNARDGTDHQSTIWQVPMAPQEPSPYIEFQNTPVSNCTFYQQLQDFEFPELDMEQMWDNFFQMEYKLQTEDMSFLEDFSPTTLEMIPSLQGVQ